jgi:hypothetical protein
MDGSFKECPIHDDLRHSLRLDMLVHIWNPNTQETEARVSRVQGQHGLHHESEVSLEEHLIGSL